jgi:hypothetical protein
MVIDWRPVWSGRYVSSAPIDTISKKAQPTERFEGKTVAVNSRNGQNGDIGIIDPHV